MSQLSHSGLTVAMVAVGALLSAPLLAQEHAPASSTTSVVAAKPGKVPRKPLDLRVPSITRLYTSEELNRILAASFREQSIEEVEVEEERDRLPNTPTVWPGIAAPFWAMLNPAQSWRIFAPLPPDQTRGMQFVRADATEAYQLEPAGLARPDSYKLTQ